LFPMYVHMFDTCIVDWQAVGVRSLRMMVYKNMECLSCTLEATCKLRYCECHNVTKQCYQ